MHKSRISKISLAVCLAFMPIYGLAAGLGKLSVNSGLGEPLKAEIDLISVTPDELSSLSAVIASEEAYALQGIPRLSVHNNIRVELAKNPDGSPVLRLRSLQPIDDPYLDMLIQVDWASGRLLREYTILLDPPGYKQSLSDELISKSVSNKATVESSPTIASTAEDSAVHEMQQHIVDKSNRKKRVADITDQAGVSTQKGISGAANETPEVTTRHGDTLNSIAKEMQVEGVSLDQMLIGLFEANKNAFVDGNMNRLKVGQIIKVPSKESLTAISSQQATKEVKVHSANWNAYRNSLAGNVLAAPVAEETEHKQSASGKIASAEDKAEAIKSGPQDVVKLSAGGKVAAQSGKAGAEADAKFLALQEEATAREKALKEAQERAAALESQIADMQKLLALKSQTMADMQKNADAAGNVAVSKQPAVAPQSASSPESATAAASETNVTAVPPVVAEPAATQAPEATKDTPKVVKKVKPVITPVQPEPEPSFLDSLLESVNLFMLGGAGLVALLGAGWVYLRNKRRKGLDSFERGILTSGGLRANTVFGNTTGNATSSADTSFLTDFAQSADGTMIDTNDVDPIAEAEVYMAYGRDAQAEEILKDAISKEPNRYELHLKLLEMYAARKDVSAFEAIAGELYTTLGSDDPTWAKVAELGATVEPDNPLYDLSQVSSSVTPVRASEADTDASSADLDLDKDLVFSFDEKTKLETDAQSLPVMQSATPDQNAIQNVSFDFGSENNESASSAVESSLIAENADNIAAAAEDTNATADNSVDFDFPDLGSFTLGAEASSDADKEPSLDMADQQENISTFELPDISGSNQDAELAVTALADDSNAIAGLDFNFTEKPDVEAEIEVPTIEEAEGAVTASDFNFEGFANAAVPDEEGKTESSALDAMDVNFEGFGEVPIDASEEKQEVVSALEGLSLDFDSEDAATVKPDNENPEEISFDLPLTDVQEPIVEDQESNSSNQNEANNFDFSAISLDMGGNESHATETSFQASAETSVSDMMTEAPAVIANENPDVDIKLDLVKVYIDMEDIEGARDLLDEVLKEGGPQQRSAAEKLLASLA